MLERWLLELSWPKSMHKTLGSPHPFYSKCTIRRCVKTWLYAFCSVSQTQSGKDFITGFMNWLSKMAQFVTCYNLYASKVVNLYFQEAESSTSKTIKFDVVQSLLAIYIGCYGRSQEQTFSLAYVIILERMQKYKSWIEVCETCWEQLEVMDKVLEIICSQIYMLSYRKAHLRLCMELIIFALSILLPFPKTNQFSGDWEEGAKNGERNHLARDMSSSGRFSHKFGASPHEIWAKSIRTPIVSLQIMLRQLVKCLYGLF